MPGTRRLYYDDSWLLAFDARVEAHGAFGGRPSVILDQTAFYPEAGGQMADRGVLAGVPVTDVQVDEAGIVHHILDGERPRVGAGVHGEIDKRRRRVHMALHTGQHMLSRALLDVVRGETVSSRLGETSCTIDLSIATAEERAIARAEDLVNDVIDDDVAIRAFFPSPAELASLPLRREPKVDNEIRVVQIGEFDLSPCGGTHCTRSGQVALVHVTGVERKGGRLRVTFTAGPRARRELSTHADFLKDLSRDFTCGPLELRSAIERLQRELTETRETLGKTRAQMAGAVANDLLAAAGDPPFVVAAFEGASDDFLTAVARRVTAHPTGVALLASRLPDGISFLCVRGPESTFDCGALVKALTRATGGRGGGRPDRAQGRLPPGLDWEALVAAHRPE